MTQLLAPPASLTRERAAGAQSEDEDEAKALDYRSVIHQKEKAHRTFVFQRDKGLQINGHNKPMCTNKGSLLASVNII